MNDKLHKIIAKAHSLEKGKELAYAEEFISLDEKIGTEFDSVKESVESILEKLDNKPEIQQVKLIGVEMIKGEKGEDGANGKDGERGEAGKDGKDYILTEADKKKIAGSIKVPVVEKIIEKIEVIKEQPIITNEIKEVAVTDQPEIIIEKINSLPTDDDELKIDAKHIKNLPKIEQVLGTGTKLLNQLQDVSVSGITNGQTLVWNSTTGMWEAGSSGGGGGSTVKVSVNDTTAGYLGAKLSSGVDTISFKTANGGANEVLDISVNETIDMAWTADQSFLSTGGILLPNGTTAERPTGTGYIRYNTSLNALEYDDNTDTWQAIARAIDYIPITGLSTGVNLNSQTVSNIGAMTITPASLTGASATSAISVIQTFNTTGSPTLIFANALHTNSGTSTLLIDLQYNSVSQFKVNKSGQGTINQMTIGTININSNIIQPSINGFMLLSSGRTWNFANGDATNKYLKVNESLSTATSGTLSPVTLSTGFAPTSGTATMSYITVDGTINQTGGASGITRGLYVNPTLTASADFRAIQVDSGSIFLSNTITAGGTTGNQTINKISGTVNIAAAGTAVTVTNSLVTTSSLVFAVIRTNDATAQIKSVVPAAGSFVINIAACTAEVSIGFFVINK